MRSRNSWVCICRVSACLDSSLAADKTSLAIRPVSPEIWETSPLFKDLRDYSKYEGKCGECEYIKVCGGCRARAHAATGNYLAEEPLCTYEPGRAAAGKARG